MRIDLGTAQELILNYKQNHWTIINGCCPSLRQNPVPNIQDSRSVWFGLNELQDFIADISAAGGNGIRFYFGEYSADIVHAPANKGANGPNIGQYTGMQTLVLMPTKPSPNNNMNCDFNIVGTNGTDFEFENLDDLCAMNHGTMAPPPWPVTGQAPLDFTDTCGAYFLDL